MNAAAVINALSPFWRGYWAGAGSLAVLLVLLAVAFAYILCMIAALEEKVMRDREDALS